MCLCFLVLAVSQGKPAGTADKDKGAWRGALGEMGEVEVRGYRLDRGDRLGGEKGFGS